jgi:integrase
VARRRGAVWYVKYRVPDPTRPGRVRQIEKLFGPDWSERGAPPPGFYDRRTAQAALEAILTDARRGALDLVSTGVTFEQAAIEWLRWDQHDRGWKRSTLVDRRSVLKRHLLPEFGVLPVNQITTRRVEAWKDPVAGRPFRAPAGRQASGHPARDHGAGAEVVRPTP